MIDISWTKYIELADKLGDKIVRFYNIDNTESNKTSSITTPYTSIIGINRGGNIISTMLSHKLCIPCGIVSAENSVYTMNDLSSRHHGSLQKDPTRIDRRNVHCSIQRVTISKQISIIAKPGIFDNILLVDDIADTGDTLIKVANHVKAICNSKLQVATIIYKKRSKIIPDFYAGTAPDEAWVKFPYETKGEPKKASTGPNTQYTYLPKTNSPLASKDKEVSEMKKGTIKTFLKEKAQDMGIVRDTRKTTGRAEQVEALLAENPKLTNAELCKLTGIHRSYIGRVRKRIGK